MRGALIHGVLLAVMLIYGYRTWTRDKSVQPDRGSVVLWNKAEAELAAVEYRTEKKIVRLEQRSDANGAYWWALETTIEKRPKPVEKKSEDKPAEPGAGSAAGSAAAGSGSAVAAAGSGSAGSGAGSGSAAEPPKPPEVVMEEVKKTIEYPVGDGGKKVLDAYFNARALRDLGVPTDALKKDYKLEGATNELIVSFKDGTKREFVVGGSVFNTTGGSSDRYVMDKQSGKAYVLAKDLLGSLEVGQSSLHLVDPRGFDAALIGSVQIDAPNEKPRTVARVTTGTEGQQVKTWGDPATKKADQTLANFVDNAANLKPTEYRAQLKVESLQPVMKLTYKDERGDKLGTLALYRMEKPGEVPEGVEFDPANPPKGETEYYIVTEKTRVPGLVRKDTAQRAEQDLQVVFGHKEAPKPPAGAGGGENPFGNTPLPPREPAAPGGNPHGAPGGDPHGAPGGNPHGAPAGNPHGGPAAPAPGAPAAPAAPAPGAPKAPAGGAAAPAAPAAGTPKAPAAGGAAAPAAPAAPKPAGAHDGHAH